MEKLLKFLSATKVVCSAHIYPTAALLQGMLIYKNEASTSKCLENRMHAQSRARRTERGWWREIVPRVCERERAIVTSVCERERRCAAVVAVAAVCS